MTIAVAGEDISLDGNENRRNIHEYETPLVGGSWLVHRAGVFGPGGFRANGRTTGDAHAASHAGGQGGDVRRHH